MSATEGFSIFETTSTFEARKAGSGKRAVAAVVAVLALTSCSTGTPNAESSKAAGANAGDEQPRASDSAPNVYEEIVQFNAGAPTFENFLNASGPGTVYEKGARVMVRCVIANGPKNAVESANGKWYLDAAPQKGVNMYTPANVFENNSNLSLPLSQQNEVDPQVPACTAVDIAPLKLPTAAN